MGIQDGQDVSQAITNPAFISKNVDDVTTSLLGFSNAAPASGAAIAQAQREFNSLNSFLGKSPNSVYNDKPTWTSNDVGASNNDVKTRADLTSAKFNNSTGHAHSGGAGDGAPISAPNLINVPLIGLLIQGTNYNSTAANSDNVSGLMGGLSPSGGSTSLGVVVTAPYNKVLIKNSSTGIQFEDASGNEVYGRLTYAASVWTVSYYSNVAGVETAYAFAGVNPLSWIFQQLFNPMVSTPPYSPVLFMPSLDATADVIVATTALYGKTLLSNSAAADIAAAGTIGTPNGTVANADHTHKGVHEIVPFGGSAIFGDVTLKASGGGLSVGGSGQNLTYTLAAFVGDAGAGGTQGAVPAPGVGDATKFLKGNGTWATVAGVSFTAPTVQRFLSGSGTYTTPANVLYLKLTVVGGGGGGAGSGTGTSGGTGGTGGDSTFGTGGSQIKGSGGVGGVTASAGGGGNGGAATAGTGPIAIHVLAGTMGSTPANINSGLTFQEGGVGGTGPLGGAALTAASTSNTGAGGTGGQASGVGVSTGCGGGSGGYIQAIVTSPGATFAYAVGSAGTAGGAGTSGNAGQVGGSGVVVVEEYYQ